MTHAATAPTWADKDRATGSTLPPSTALGFAYLLWLLGGLFGLHRYYLGRIGSAIAMTVLTLTVVGIFVTVIWWLVDLFLIRDVFEEQTRPPTT